MNAFKSKGISSGLYGTAVTHEAAVTGPEPRRESAYRPRPAPTAPVSGRSPVRSAQIQLSSHMRSRQAFSGSEAPV
ncbi:hypothetical protein GCM10010327_33550 [Streptomyces nitrosporeus]|nr:hypothetical protein GCM10010327_33550 [Streptomyces nitrosporeus]